MLFRFREGQSAVHYGAARSLPKAIRLDDPYETSQGESNMTTATAPIVQPTTGKTAVRQPKPLPAPNSDFYELYGTLKPEELAVVKRVREFMESKVAPIITKHWVEDSFPFELL